MIRNSMKRAFLTLLPLLQCGCVSRMFYYPDQTEYELPSRAFEDVWIQSGDGTKLHGWWIPAESERVKGTVVHCHGNAANLTGHYAQVDWLPPGGYNLLLFDYRGYGKSEGKPGRKGVYEDTIAALTYAAERSQNLFVIGQSLGGANAMAVLGRNEIPQLRALVVDSAFYSYRSIVRDKIGEMPGLRWLKWPLSFLVIGNAYSGGPVVHQVGAPVLIIHGTEDQIVPFHHGRWSYEEAGQPKTMVAIEGGYHVDVFLRYGELYQRRVLEFFEQAADYR